MDQQPKICKIVLVGDHGVGKRSLLTKAFKVSERLSPFYIPIECAQVEGKAKDTQVKLHFYDSLIKTSMVAKENNILVKQFCAEVIPSAQAVLMCFASDNAESLVNLREWAHTIKAFLKPKTFVYLVATKSDTRAHIDSDVYEEIKSEIGSIHGRFSTSSVTGENIEGLFAHIMKNFVRLPFTHNECVLKEEMASIHQGIATPRKSVTPHGTPSFVMVTPEKRVVYHESTTFEEVVISRGYTDMNTRTPQEVRGARALDATADHSGFHRHTRSAHSFAWKQERKSIVDEPNKLLPKYIDQDLTQPEDEAEVQMDYLRPGKMLSDDLIKFATPYSERRRPTGEEMRDNSVEIKISYMKEVVSEKEHWKSEVVPQAEMIVEDESKLETPKHYIKIWF